MTASAAQIAKAQQMLDSVKAGQTVFTKAADEWLVIGPVADITPGAVVMVIKRDGTTTQVQISRVTRTGEKQDTPYAVAAFRNVPNAAPRREAAPRTTRRADRMTGEWVTTTVYSDGAHVTRDSSGTTITYD